MGPFELQSTSAMATGFDVVAAASQPEFHPPAVVESVDQALVMVDRAYGQLCAAVTFQDTRQIRNLAVAAAAFAREAKDTRLLDKATELRTRAERKAGHMLRESAEKGERALPKTSRRTDLVETNDEVSAAPTLAEIGVTRDQSSKWQQVAALTDDEFEEALETTKAITHEISTPKVLRAVQQARQKAAPQEMEVGTDDDVVVVLDAPVATPDEQAVAFYNAVRALADITCTAEQLREAVPYYQHFRIAESIAPALDLLQKVSTTWKT